MDEETDAPLLIFGSVSSEYSNKLFAPSPSGSAVSPDMAGSASSGTVNLAASQALSGVILTTWERADETLAR
jgi:hypothetical protein